MANEWLPGFEKDQTMIYNDCELSLMILQINWIAVIHQLMFSSKMIRKLEIIGCDRKKKTSASEGVKIVRAAKWLCSVTSQQLEVEIN